MGFAIDFSWATPSGQEMQDNFVDVALAYTGSGKPRPSADYIADMQAHSVEFYFIQESTATRPFEGYSAGFVDAQYADARADEVSYPRDKPIFYNLGDTPNVSGHEGQIAEYTRGVRDGTVRPIGGYGGRASIEAGLSVVPSMLRWGVRTWGYSGATDADLIQEPNIPSPIPNTDYNTILNSALADWGTHTVEPTQEVEAMECWWGLNWAGVSIGVLMSGGRHLRDFGGAPGAYGVCQELLDWKAQPGKEAVPLILVDADLLGQAQTPWPPAPPASPGTPYLDVEASLKQATEQQLLTEVGDRMT